VNGSCIKQDFAEPYNFTEMSLHWNDCSCKIVFITWFFSTQ